MGSTMSRCGVCGNAYDKAFQVTMPETPARTFDSFGWAIQAPGCECCDFEVIGHGVEADGRF